MKEYCDTSLISRRDDWTMPATGGCGRLISCPHSFADCLAGIIILSTAAQISWLSIEKHTRSLQRGASFIPPCRIKTTPGPKRRLALSRHALSSLQQRVVERGAIANLGLRLSQAWCTGVCCCECPMPFPARLICRSCPTASGAGPCEPFGSLMSLLLFVHFVCEVTS